MDYKRALKWAFHYKLLSWVAAGLGLGLFALGWVVGLSGLYGAYQSGDVVSALSVGTVLGPVILTLLGFVVWQLGKTLAFYRTLSTAIETEMAQRFDAEMVKSDILSVLDERLEEMHQELESANRAIRKLDGGDPAAKAGFEPTSPSDGSRAGGGGTSTGSGHGSAGSGQGSAAGGQGSAAGGQGSAGDGTSTGGGSSTGGRSSTGGGSSSGSGSSPTGESSGNSGR